MINSTINLPKLSTRKKTHVKISTVADLTKTRWRNKQKQKSNSYPQNLKIKSFPIWFVLFSYVFLLSQNNVSNFTSYLFAYFVASRKKKKMRICIIKHLYSGVFCCCSFLLLAVCLVGIYSFILLVFGFSCCISKCVVS